MTKATTSTKLTQIQADTFKFIRRYMAEQFVSPAVKDISEHFKITPNAAQDRLTALERKQAVTRMENKHRSIRIVKGFKIVIKGNDND